jgi:hypothetical protein
MRDTAKEYEVIQQLIQWAEGQVDVRAMLLTSSRIQYEDSAKIDFT